MTQVDSAKAMDSLTKNMALQTGNSRPLSEYRGETLPFPRFWGLSDEVRARHEQAGRRNKYSVVVAVLILALTAFLAPLHGFARNLLWRQVILRDMGSVFPVIRVAYAVSPLPGLAALLWAVNLPLLFIVFLPVGWQTFPRRLRDCDYSLVRLVVWRTRPLSGTSMRHAVQFAALVGALSLAVALNGDIRGYWLWERHGPSALTLMAHAKTYAAFGLFSGWDYVHQAFYYLANSTRAGLLAAFVYNDVGLMGFAATFGLLATILGHYRHVRRTTKCDEETLNALYARWRGQEKGVGKKG